MGDMVRHLVNNFADLFLRYPKDALLLGIAATVRVLCVRC